MVPQEEMTAKAGREIPTLLEDLNLATLNLQDIIGALGDRLTPVMPQQPGGGEPTKDYDTLTDMGGFIALLVQRLTNANNVLNDMYKRVEL